MSEAVTQTTAIPVEAILRDKLAHGDAALSTIAPILGHLVISPENSLFSDEIVAHVRGMAASVAKQLVCIEAKVGESDAEVLLRERQVDLARDLLCDARFLSHCHALTVERALTDRLFERTAMDRVLSPMLQALVSSDDAVTASAAMATLTAQARFIQQQRRMELPITEMSGELFHDTVLIWRASLDEKSEASIAEAESDLRAQYDESKSRLGLLARLVSSMGSGARAALSISHAGTALFLSAIAHLSSQSRDIAAITTHEGQVGRLGLSLRAGGLKPAEIEEQFLHIHPEISLPEGFDQLRVDRAQEMLASSALLADGLR